MKEGALDYLFKAFDPEGLWRVVGEALEVSRRMRAPAVIAEADPDLDGTIVGTCPAMLKVYKAIGLVAAQNVAVLITGESGTGKELIVRELYQHSLRPKAPFLAINQVHVRYYLPRFSRELGRYVHEIGPDASRLLHNYSWPGNIRELQSVLTNAILQSRGTTQLPGSLPHLLGTSPGPGASPHSTAGDPGLEACIGRCLASLERDLYAESHRQVDRILLARAIEGTGGNLLRATRWLGISRETLRRRLREVRIHFNRRVEADSEG
jgi:DNA-binding NtrC family response regulator